ncbi:MAG TPA: AsmA-like C-terminal region-containing protein, partial [Burkholderiaceae bacterium]|nr:AsmA-like C-terminal region-containing protein [Burkholderiaceae bacterium]
AQAPPRLPSIDMSIEELRLGAIPLGAALLKATQLDPQSPRWRIDELRVTNPEATLAVSGRWAPRRSAVGSFTSLRFELAAADVGALLRRLGHDGLLTAGEGTATGRLRWTGTPAAPDVERIGGEVQLALARGRFPQVDVGAARWLSAFSLRPLLRGQRVDVDADGFDFDSMRGSFALRQGIATTDDFEMRGPYARVRIRGTSSLVEQTHDLTVTVEPRIDFSLAVLSAAIANPAAGLVALVAQTLLRGTNALRRSYTVEGPWRQPDVNALLPQSAVWPDERLSP